MKWKLIFVCFVGLVLEWMIIPIAGFLPFLKAHKKHLGGSAIPHYFSHAFENPFGSIHTLVAQRNPLFFIGQLFVLFVMIVILVRSSSEGRYKMADSYGAHGSSRWARFGEIVRPGETVSVSRKLIWEDMVNSDQTREEEDETGSIAE